MVKTSRGGNALGSYMLSIPEEKVVITIQVITIWCIIDSEVLHTRICYHVPQFVWLLVFVA